MDVLLVAVWFCHHLLTGPLHLVELLLDAMQRLAIGLTTQRSADSLYRRSFPLSLLFVLLLCVRFFCVSLFVLLPVGALFGDFYVGRLLPSLCVRVCQTTSF